MDKATAIVTRALNEKRSQFLNEIQRQALDSNVTAVESCNAMARKSARARAHNLMQIHGMKDAREMCGNMGAMILSLNAACCVLSIPPSERTAAALDWESSLKA